MTVEGREQRLRARQWTTIHRPERIFFNEKRNLTRLIVAREAYTSLSQIETAANIGKLKGHFCA